MVIQIQDLQKLNEWWSIKANKQFSVFKVQLAVHVWNQMSQTEEFVDNFNKTNYNKIPLCTFMILLCLLLLVPFSLESSENMMGSKWWSSKRCSDTHPENKHDYVCKQFIFGKLDLHCFKMFTESFCAHELHMSIYFSCSETLL